MSTVTVDLHEYVDLLCRANVTDPVAWPAEARQGAALLARIRQIESDCAAQHGKWDWELISPELQDEYDSARGELDKLRYAKGKGVSWEEFKERNSQYKD